MARFAAAFSLLLSAGSVVADSPPVVQLPSSGPQVAVSGIGAVLVAEGTSSPSSGQGTSVEAALLKNVAAASQAAAEANAVARNAAVAAQAASYAAAAAVQQAGLTNAPEAGQQVVVAGVASAESASTAPAWSASTATHTVAVPGVVPSRASRLSGLIALIAGFSFVAIVKAFCMLSNVLVQVSPLPQVRRWETRLCTAASDPAPYVSICFGGWQWCYYGMFAYLYTGRGGFLILVQSNFLGAGLGTYYTYTFWKHCSNGEMRAKLMRYLNFVYGLVLIQCCTLAVFPLERDLFFAGLVASFCSFLGAMSMLVTVQAVIETKNSSPIPGPIVVANFFSGVVWCFCGWILADPLVMGPNIIAVAASGICIYLKVLFPESGSGLASKDQDVEQQMPEGTSKISEATPLARELITVKPRSTIGPPKKLCEDLLAEDVICPSVLVDDCYGGTGGTW